MTLKTTAIINLGMLLITLTVNALANALPINGLNTGQVSALYPNLFVPDGVTFSIWSVIYFWLLLFAAWGFRVAFGQKATASDGSQLMAVAPWFWANCLLNATWILAWHYLQIWWSLLLMLGLIGTLIRIFLLLIPNRHLLSGQAYGFMALPMVLYLGWICVATIANTTALLVHLGWTGGGLLPPETWSSIMIAVATLLGGLLLWRWRQVLFVVVIVWALWGIYRAQADASPLIGTTALVCISISVLAVGAHWWQQGFRTRS